ncbi:MAG: hypothetical protein R2941_12485 [Desulfobacterales bacterium]
MIMAPAADMFEMGVKVQVLKKGNHVSSRRKLHELYNRHACYEDIPLAQGRFWDGIFQSSFAEAWAGTRHFSKKTRSPAECPG